MSPFSDFGFWMSHKIEIFSEKKEREQKREREERGGNIFINTLTQQ